MPQPYRRPRRALLSACALALLPLPAAHAIVSSNGPTTPFDGLNINQFIGAEDFYNLGYTGTRAAIANVEAGHIWDGHEDLGTTLFFDPATNSYTLAPRVSAYVNDPSLGDHTTLYDWHATMVGHVLGGYGQYYGYILQDTSGHLYNGAYGYGIAPSATLVSAAIATSWIPTPGSDFTGSFNTSPQTTLYAYKSVMQTGVNGRRADVVNSSWGEDDPDGSSFDSKLVDALAYANHQTVVLAAGNHDPADPSPSPVTGPASGFNSISVAALASDTSSPPYSHVADFSNTGVNDFTNPNLPTKYRTSPQSRVAVDIAAPGDNLTLAAYLGLTGGHTSNTNLLLTPDTLNGSQFYFLDEGGTSFASPVVAGAASLLVDAGYDKFHGGTSVDGRVIKAVLLNSASKTPGWNNGLTNVSGVLRTTQALDPAVGTGALNLHHALPQYTAGTTDVPGISVSNAPVQKIGWDFAQAAPNTDNDYYITDPLAAGETLTATLDWFVNRQLDESALATATDPAAAITDVSFADLDLQVWLLQSGLPTQLIASSESAYSNVEHLYFALPTDGQYMLRVHYYADAYNPTAPTLWTAEDYALAWSVPEPTAALLFLALAPLLTLPRRRRPLPAPAPSQNS